MVETFYDLEELVDAIEAVRGVSSLPIVALLTFDERAETLAGVTAREAADRLSDRSTSRPFGANHGAGLLAALAALEEMGKTAVRWPRCRTSVSRASSGRRVIYPHANAGVLRRVRRLRARRSGARIIGGCCGTTPAEIAAIHAAVDRGPQAAGPLVLDERELVVALGGEQPRPGWRVRYGRANASSRRSSTRRSARTSPGLVETSRRR